MTPTKTPKVPRSLAGMRWWIVIPQDSWMNTTHGAFSLGAVMRVNGGMGASAQRRKHTSRQAVAYA